MTKVTGRIITPHQDPSAVAGSLSPDNLMSMKTGTDGDQVVTTISADRIRSVIASVDDYLTNLTVAEDLCSLVSD